VLKLTVSCFPNGGGRLAGVAVLTVVPHVDVIRDQFALLDADDPLTGEPLRVRLVRFAR